MRTAGGPIRIALALALATLIAACGARETEQAAPDPPTFAPPTATTYQQVQISATAPPAPPITAQPATLTAAAAEGALQATAQALSLILTASPASPEGYTAIALYETAITAATQTAIPPEQRRPTPDPAQPQRPPTATAPAQPFTPGPDSQATDIASMQLTGEAATVTRAADYTATALAGGAQTGTPSLGDTQQASATATTMPVDFSLPTPTETPTAALRYYLPPDMVQRYTAIGWLGPGSYYISVVPRGEQGSATNTIVIAGGASALAVWPQLRPDRPRSELRPVRVRGVEGVAEIFSEGGSTVAWLEGGQAYLVSAGGRNVAEMVAIAEALVPVEQADWEAQLQQAQQ